MTTKKAIVAKIDNLQQQATAIREIQKRVERRLAIKREVRTCRI